MNLHSLDFNILKHLNSLIEEKNVSKAAKKAGISQPAMSKSLKKIRELFHDDILIDNGKGYSLTEKAILLKDPVSKILKDMDQLLNPCEKFDPFTENASIKIVSSDYGNLFYLPKILEITQKYPNIKLEVYSPQEQDLNKLQEESIDFYLGIGKMSLLPENLIVKKIFSEKLLSAVSQHHPIDTTNVSVQDFISYPHMLISNLNLNTGRNSLVYNKGILDYELDKLGVKRNVSVVVPHFTTAPILLQNSNLILSAPSKLIQYYQGILKLKTFNPPVEEIPTSDFYLAWHLLSLNKRSNIWFKENIINKITKEF